ncbi:MAG: aryl-sulfate sulfotransferase [Gemmatimonadota bacterium]
MIRKLALVAVAVVLSACGSDNKQPTQPAVPVVNSFSVTANENNVLSAIAALELTHADSAHVVYWTGSEAKQTTPFTSDLSSGRTVIVGLRPETQYSMYVEAAGGGTTVSSDTVAFTTGALDPFLAASNLTGDPVLTGGYVISALQSNADGYFTVFDSTGHVAWYRKFPGQTVAELKQQANGDFTAILTTTHGGEPVTGSAVELALDGSTVRTFNAPATSPYIDDHELWLLFNNGAYDGALFFAYNQHHVDLSSTGGPADSLISGHQLIREDATGAQHVVFDAWDHFQVSDNVEPAAAQVDFDHPNAITFDTDGNYVVSWRNLDAITKINAVTGELMWTLASSFSKLPSDFTVVDDPLNGFSAQHSSRILPNGNLLLLDNGTRHPTPASRIVEYKLDPSAHTASLVWQYQHSPALYTQFTGSVQRLQNGNTFIGWTWLPTAIAQEVTSDMNTVWEAPLVATGTQLPYRFTKIRSLYGYEAP